MALEAEAVSLWHFAVSVLPGLLQTPGYAREVLVAGGLKGKELEKQVEARLGRRELLEVEDAAPFRTILSEAVLRTPLRDAGEWREQLEYLSEVAERPNATIQVLLQSAGSHGLLGMDVWYLLLPQGRTVAYTENGYGGRTHRRRRSGRTFAGDVRCGARPGAHPGGVTQVHPADVGGSDVRSIDLSAASWRKSSYSNQDGGACVELSDDLAVVVPVRDSKTPHGPVLVFPAGGWSSFVAAVKSGRLGG
jgi:hypothetical protein